MPRRYLPRSGLTRPDGRPTVVLEQLLRSLREIPEWVKSTEQRTLAAALTPTTLATAPAEHEALYKFTYYVRIVRAATISSSLQVTFTWTDGGVTQTYTAPALTGNTTDTHQVLEEVTIRADPGTEVTVETSYSSTGATDMQYDVDAAAERIDQRGGLNPRHVL